VHVNVGLNTIICLVVSTPLKNIRQLGLLFPIYGKVKNGAHIEVCTNVVNQMPKAKHLLVILHHPKG